ncbi:MAG: 30S ribosomal protein S20 [Rhodospirillaceae bacterium]|nr:30S ribosomal protein S20 [Rhodospirillaceae bacterium]|tara:strand:- start:86 stop:346 length:261 start_codon:yes stop_codon:yes gene_type:complete
MANIKSAKKRARQNIKRRQHNMTLRSRLRTTLRNAHEAIQSNDRKVAQEGYKAAVPQIDKMITKGIITKNRGARYKSRLNSRVREI